MTSGIIEQMQASLKEAITSIELLKHRIGVLENERKVGEVKLPEPMLAQQIRDEIIEKAKRDVPELKSFEYSHEGYYPVNDPRCNNPWLCNADFTVNKEKRTIVVLLKGVNSRTIYAKGIAKCDPSDCFNVHIGKAIALRRALGLEVPAEYLNVPQPTEVRVGDVCEWVSQVSGTHEVVITKMCPEHDGERYGIAFYHSYMDGYLGNKQVRIIDDSRE